jgi:hypothetical protein
MRPRGGSRLLTTRWAVPSSGHVPSRAMPERESARTRELRRGLPAKLSVTKVLKGAPLLPAQLDKLSVLSEKSEKICGFKKKLGAATAVPYAT